MKISSYARWGSAAQKQIMDAMLKSHEIKRSKYGNHKVTRDGIKFDSEREAARYGELKLLLEQGQIRNLRLQANFTLIEGYTTVEGERIKPMVYRADFTYERATALDCTGAVHWLREVEDAKGMHTQAYELKKKLMLEKFGIAIREV